MSGSALQSLREQISSAAADGCTLRIRGGGSKDFYGNNPQGSVLDVRAYTGIVSHEPSELVVTARCGTPLLELDQVLRERGQMLGFEPPNHDGNATVGGCIAAGLAGPSRMAAGYRYGGVRESVLGTAVIDGRNRLLRFGGTVLKNVAGYDVSRLFAGSLGALGLIAEVSLKVLPQPPTELSLQFELEQRAALRLLASWRASPLPITATSWLDQQLRVRLGGEPAAVQAARAGLGGSELTHETAAAWWSSLRHQSLAFFRNTAPLWRVSLPANAPGLELPGTELQEWSGMQRWLYAGCDAALVRTRAAALGGHATLYRRDAGVGATMERSAFAPLPAASLALHRRLRAVFDPHAVFDFGRLVVES